jgi:hypothetical protein
VLQAGGELFYKGSGEIDITAKPETQTKNDVH